MIACLMPVLLLQSDDVEKADLDSFFLSFSPVSSRSLCVTEDDAASAAALLLLLNHHLGDACPVLSCLSASVCHSLSLSLSPSQSFASCGVCCCGLSFVRSFVCSFSLSRSLFDDLLFTSPHTHTHTLTHQFTLTCTHLHSLVMDSNFYSILLLMGTVLDAASRS